MRGRLQGRFSHILHIQVTLYNYLYTKIKSWWETNAIRIEIFKLSAAELLIDKNTNTITNKKNAIPYLPAVILSTSLSDWFKIFITYCGSSISWGHIKYLLSDQDSSYYMFKSLSAIQYVVLWGP